jgi:hypothetical protein
MIMMTDRVKKIVSKYHCSYKFSIKNPQILLKIQKKSQRSKFFKKSPDLVRNPQTWQPCWSASIVLCC